MWGTPLLIARHLVLTPARAGRAGQDSARPVGWEGARGAGASRRLPDRKARRAGERDEAALIEAAGGRDRSSERQMHRQVEDRARRVVVRRHPAPTIPELAGL